MKWVALLGALSGVLLSSCSERDGGAEPSAAAAMRKLEEITKRGILADFVKAISEDEDDKAIALLHPTLAEAWTKERFSHDWKGVRKQLGGGWQPTAMGSFSGSSPFGPYLQATYRLASDCRSLASLDLTSMQADGKPAIVKIEMRVPYAGNAPAEVNGLTDRFLAAMLKEDYAAAGEMLSDSARASYPREMFAQIRPTLGKSPQSTSRNLYRLCANTVWYDAVRLTPTDDPACFLEIVVSHGQGRGEIVFLAFKARAHM